MEIEAEGEIWEFLSLLPKSDCEGEGERKPLLFACLRFAPRP